MDSAILWSFRLGTIPASCGGASFCFAIYAAKVQSAVYQWERVQDPVAPQYARKLRQHAATVAAMAAASGAVTMEAYKDFRSYSTAHSMREVESFFIKQLPFFARPSVLGTALLAVSLVQSQVGGVCFTAPTRPMLWKRE